MQQASKSSKSSNASYTTTSCQHENLSDEHSAAATVHNPFKLSPKEQKEPPLYPHAHYNIPYPFGKTALAVEAETSSTKEKEKSTIFECLALQDIRELSLT
jgi:hypothetical protein